MSISTKRGDQGQTDLVGRVRVSKSDLRVESYGTIDELTAQLGFARSICPDPEVGEIIKGIQHDLFKLGSAVATSSESKKRAEPITPDMVGVLDSHVQRIEAMKGIVGDWSLPGEVPEAAALDVARTVCRRAERCVVRLGEKDTSLQFQVLVYLNRLSDLLWLLGRLLEVRAGVDSTLRPKNKSGRRWSPAW